MSSAPATHQPQAARFTPEHILQATSAGFIAVIEAMSKASGKEFSPEKMDVLRQAIAPKLAAFQPGQPLSAEEAKKHFETYMRMGFTVSSEKPNEAALAAGLQKFEETLGKPAAPAAAAPADGGIYGYVKSTANKAKEETERTKEDQTPEGFSTSDPIMSIRDFIMQLIYSITYFLGGDKVVQPPEAAVVASAAPTAPSAPECSSPQCDLAPTATPAIAVKPIRQR